MDVILDGQFDVLPVKSTPLLGVQDPYHQLLRTYGYLGQDAPVGDFLRAYHGLSGRWLVASPVFWQATHRDAMIAAGGVTLDITAEASRKLCTAFAEFLLEDNIRLHYHNHYTWLIQTDEPLDATALNGVLGQSIRPFLEACKSTPFWLRFITESQLFLHTHAEQQGIQVNGLWVWGAGPLEEPQDRSLVICSHNPLWERACSRLSSLVTYDTPGLSVTKDTVFFVPDHACQYAPHLEARLTSTRVDWYWSNQAYTIKPLPWFKRFWRR